TGGLTIDGLGTMYVQDGLTNAGGVTKNDAGNLILSSANNTFTGNLLLNAGVTTLLSVGGGNVTFGTPVGGSTLTVASGAVLQLSSNTGTPSFGSTKPVTLLAGGTVENVVGQ